MNTHNKKILFLSAIDFKDKSIQVIRKTPEAYRDHGFDVSYVVARDNVSDGNYFYEQEINPDNLKIKRFYWPFPKLRGSIQNRWLKLIISKIASLYVIIKLFYAAIKLKPASYSVIYGYEYHGVLAMQLIKFILFITNTKHNIQFISRFQGTFLYEMIKKKQYLRIIFNLDLILALRLPSQLFIMTNDGTQGDKALKIINPKQKCLFLVNGVEEFKVSSHEVNEIRKHLNMPATMKIILSVSRLTGWKRVDRNIKIFKKISELDNNFKYIIIGDGDTREQLEKLVIDLRLNDKITFIGSVPNTVIKNYLAASNFFISMYDSSNVGNPLLEAIRSKKIIITLNNGDTGEWINHKVNGLIYSETQIDSPAYMVTIAQDIIDLSNIPEAFNNMTSEIELLESNKIYSWKKRFSIEIDSIYKEL